MISRVRADEERRPSIEAVCRHLGVSRQGYYQWKARQARVKEVEERVLDAVREKRRILPKLGARKLYYMFKKLIPFGRDAFFRLLKRHGLLVRRKARAPLTTCATDPPTKNLIGKTKPKRAGEVLVSDITYVRLPLGHCYLALVTDLCSRRIIGSHVSSRCTAAMCIKALRKALGVIGGRARETIHHSDRGKQYTGKDYTDVLRHHGVRISTTQKQHCAENAVAERVNGILKHELMLKATFSSVEQARCAADEAINIYNRKRPHTALAYATPEVYFNNHI